MSTRETDWLLTELCPSILSIIYLENNSKQISVLIGFKPCFQQKTRFGTIFLLKSPLVSFAAVVRVITQCFSLKPCVMTLTTAAIET